MALPEVLLRIRVDVVNGSISASSSYFIVICSPSLLLGILQDNDEALFIYLAFSLDILL